MFESLSDASRKAILRAQEEAKIQQHTVIGREHLSSGILLTAPNVLEDLGSHRKTLEWAAWVRYKRADSKPTGTLPFGEGIREAFDVARAVALLMGSPLVEPEHLAAGLAATSMMVRQ